MPSPLEDDTNPELALHIKALVDLYFDQVIQELDQRIRDLELLVGQPEGAVQFTTKDPNG